MSDRSDAEAQQLRARVAALEAELACVRAAASGIEWTAEAVLVHDLAGRILVANERAAELLGCSVEALLRRDMFDLEETLRDADREATREAWLLTSPDLPIIARGRFLRSDGAAVPVELTVIARDVAGVRQIHLVARDITDRLRVERALRDSEQRFRFLFEASPVSMLRARPHGELLQVNRALGAWLGLAPEAAPGVPARMLVTPDDRPEFDALFAALSGADDRPRGAQLRLLAAGARPVWSQLTLFAEADNAGGLRQIIGVLEDIDARKQAEAQVQALLTSLEGQVEARTAELQRTNQLLRVEIGERERTESLLVRAHARAEAASQAKSRFLMVISHELRTPLNAILGYTEMHLAGLKGDEPLAPPEELASDLASIRISGHHLLSLIDDILHMTQLESGDRQQAPAAVELLPLLHRLVDAARARLSGPDLEVVLLVDGDLGTIETDVVKLEHVLRHLLGNAVKFTPRGRVELRAARIREPAGEHLRLDVCDTGIGIPPEQRSLLFTPFVQLDDSPTRRYGGLGLGLALCRRYCDELGGSIAVKSAPGQGSWFTVRIPIAGAL
ncbi:sensor histidine kinase [Nannocystis pusilla]|uniref:histidine kinase n=1 Tax=Nannocystis pusilla TaxID=889268 RepID=A0ABS7TR77_9BACT|nr:PAS domain-containing hybrid sensor histidine kinase/response regulator [Nannocystis pusilla]MBZ5710744.1 PAS domain S-box protein [Nannocystis pusilla]